MQGCSWWVQGGNARESTVATMQEEVEAHALYEKTAALARAAGSRRMPKLRPFPSSRALASQPSIPLHKLVEKHLSSAASIAEQITTSPDDQPNADLAAMHLQAKDMARTPSKHTMHTPHNSSEQRLQLDSSHQQILKQQPPLLGREAQLLLGPYKPPPANTCSEPLSESVKQTKPKDTDIGKAVMCEEKYHRAGREVLGQHTDAAAAALAAQERAKQRMKAEKLRLGYNPLKHKAEPHEHAVGLSASLGTCTATPYCFKYASAI